MAINASSWSTTAASNGSLLSGVDVAENCASGNLNNGIRSVMAGIKEILNAQGGAATSGGSANAQTLTTGLAISAYAQNLLLSFEAGFTNTGATTLAIDSLTAKNVKRVDGTALSAGDITAGGIYLIAYESGADVVLLLNPTPATVGATLTAIGALAVTDNNIIVGNGSTWVAESGATARTSLGVAIGTDVQAYDAELAALAGLTSAADKLPYFIGSGSAAVTDLTSTGRSILDDASVAAVRATISAATLSQTTEFAAGMILGSLSNRDYRLGLALPHGGTITSVTTRCVSGTATATWKVNTTALGGTANAVSSSEQAQAHSSTNTFVAGDDLVCTISSNSSCVDMSFTIQYTRTLL